MESRLEELHKAWQTLSEQQESMVRHKEAIEERMAMDARNLANVNLQLQALEKEKLELLPRLADAAMAVHGTCATTGASGSRLPSLSHMR